MQQHLQLEFGSPVYWYISKHFSYFGCGTLFHHITLTLCPKEVELALRFAEHKLIIFNIKTFILWR